MWIYFRSKNIIPTILIFLFSVIPDNVFVISGEYILLNRIFVGLYYLLLFYLMVYYLKNYYLFFLNYIWALYAIIIFFGFIIGIIYRNDFKYILQNFTTGIGGLLAFLYGRKLFRSYGIEFSKIFLKFLIIGSLILSFIMIVHFGITRRVLHFSNVRYFPVAFSFALFQFLNTKNFTYLMNMLIIFSAIILTLKRSLLIFTLIFAIIVISSLKVKIKKSRIIFFIIIFSISIFSVYKPILDEISTRFLEFKTGEIADLLVFEYANSYFSSFLNNQFFIILFGKGGGATIPFVHPILGDEINSNFIDNLYSTTITKYGILGVLMNYVVLLFLLTKTRFHVKFTEEYIYFLVFTRVMWVFLFIYLLLSWISSWFFYTNSALLLWLIEGFLFESKKNFAIQIR